MEKQTRGSHCDYITWRTSRGDELGIWTLISRGGGGSCDLRGPPVRSRQCRLSGEHLIGSCCSTERQLKSLYISGFLKSHLLLFFMMCRRYTLLLNAAVSKVIVKTSLAILLHMPSLNLAFSFLWISHSWWHTAPWFLLKMEIFQKMSNI